MEAHSPPARPRKRGLPADDTREAVVAEHHHGHGDDRHGQHREGNAENESLTKRCHGAEL